MKPHNTYEQTWQDAFSEASMMPSEKVWAGIEQELDGGRTLNGWLTMWLVAASVSLAMAFPFSLGESQLPTDYFELESFSAKTPLDSQIDPPVESSTTLVAEDKNADLTTQADIINQVVISLDSEPETVERPNQEFRPANISGEYSIAQVGNYEQSKFSMPSHLYGLVGFKPELDETGEDSPRYLSANLGGGQGQMSSGIGSALAQEDASPNFSLSGGHRGSSDYIPGGFENPRRILSAGGAYEIGVGQRGALQLGLSYMNSHATGTSNKLLQLETDLAPLAYNDEPEVGLLYLTDSYDYQVTDHYASVPVMYKYAFLQRKFTIRGGLGTSFDFLLSHKVNSSTFGNKNYSGSQVGMNTAWVSLLANVEFGYWITPSYLLSVESGLRNGFGLGNSNSQNTNQSNYSLGVKFTYKLR